MAWLIALLGLMGAPAQAQDVGLDVSPGRLLLEDDARRAVHTLSTHGPTGGMVVDIAYGPGEPPTVYALTETGLFAYDRKQRFWERTPVLAPADVTTPPVPMRVDMAHLIGERELYPPMSVELLMGERYAYLMSERGFIYRAPLDGGPWKSISPSRDTSSGALPFEAASRLSIARGPAQTSPIALLRSDPERSRSLEQSRLWWVKPGTVSWQRADLSGRSALIRQSRAGFGASWRYEGLMTSIAFGSGRYQVQRFIRLIEESSGLSFDELSWATLLESSPEEVREGCWDATGMMEVQTWAGEGEPPMMIAIGARTLCVSTDGGLSFNVRDSHLETTRPGEVISHMASATAFPHRDAPAGVRILVGTQALLNIAGPQTRADGGRLFKSDDAGSTWTDVTPDIDAAGGFVDLESYAFGSGDGAEVWLLTERRGAYLSTSGSLGFDQANVALAAQPIHSMATDPTSQDTVMAVGPAGVFTSSGALWIQNSYLPTRSIGVVPATPEDRGQIWTGSYWGHVIIRGQQTGPEAEELPIPDPTDPMRRAVDIKATFGQLKRPIPVSRPQRPVSIVAPVDLVEHEGKLTDRGYALVDGEGVFYRGEQGWARVALPMTPPIRVVAMLGVPLQDGPPGLMLLLHSELGSDAGGEAWMFAEPRGWRRVALPPGVIPETAARVGDRIWIASTNQRLQALDVEGRQLKLGPEMELEITCHALSSTPRDGLACVAIGEPQTAGGGPLDAERFRPLARVLTLPSSVLSGSLPPSSGVRAVPYLARNPTGRPFPPPHALTWTRNAVGDHLWLSTGIDTYAPLRAIFNQETPEPPEDEEGPPWGWIIAALIGAVGISGVWILLKRRRVHT
ncbi:MAG: hypothetical protein CMH57_08235 [Myxococcales bacterium]|nr:hypothetical protein [Myxococcales bacterium]